MNQNLLTRSAQAFHCVFPKTFTIHFCAARATTLCCTTLEEKRKLQRRIDSTGSRDARNEFYKDFQVPNRAAGLWPK